MSKWWLVLVLVSGCSAQGGERPHRWPSHRKQGDARFADLEKAYSELAAKHAALETRLKKLEDSIARVGGKQPAEAPVSSAGAGPTTTLPPPAP